MQGLLERYKAKFLSFDRTLQIVIFCSVLVTICAFLFDFRSQLTSSQNSSVTENNDESLATFIPDGFTLVPIEILNSSGMDSILGRYGTADLFREGQSSVFMSNVRLVRGIEENGPWAALVPDALSASLLEAGGRFFVAVKGPKAKPTELKTAPKLAKRRIIYEKN